MSLGSFWTLTLWCSSGSGCVTTLLAKIVGNTNAGKSLLKKKNQFSFLAKHCLVFLTTDINEFACKTTQQTGIHNEITQIEPIRTSLVDGIMPRLKNRIDILCFNPPYVVTTHEEVGSLGIEAAWAGGIDGREVIDQLLPLVKVECINQHNTKETKNELANLHMVCRTFCLQMVSSICC